MKRRLINTLLVCMLLIPVCAQNYRVASVTGNVQYNTGGTWATPAPRDKLTGNEKIRIAERSVLSVIDMDDSKVYALKSHKEATLTAIIADQNTSAISKFFNNFMQAVTRGDSEKVSHTANVVYKDIQTDLAVYAALNATDYISAYPVEMSLIDSRTGNEIVNQSEIGQEFFFRITNNSDIPLFINVMGISSDREYYDCLPIDLGGTMLHLLVPAQATVDFKAYPMEFDEPAGTDRLILVALDRPFDLRNITKAYKENESVPRNKEKTGIYQLAIEIKGK